MMLKGIVSLAIALSLQLSFAQDFKKSYAISAGGHIVIWNFRGNIKVTGYKGSKVEIIGQKRGPDRDLIEIVDNSFGDRIDVHPRYLQFGHGNAMVDFEVYVPSTTEYNFDRLASFGGKVEVSDVIGRLRAESRVGDVEVKNVRGLVSASSVSGNVSVDIDQASGRNNMRFSSISGDVIVRAPAELDALVDMSSISGFLKTDFPIEIQEMRYGSGRSARGKLGTGSQLLNIRSVSGEVSLIRK
jgi:hypothetical protein